MSGSSNDVVAATEKYKVAKVVHLQQLYFCEQTQIMKMTK